MNYTDVKAFETNNTVGEILEACFGVKSKVALMDAITEYDYYVIEYWAFNLNIKPLQLIDAIECNFNKKTKFEVTFYDEKEHWVESQLVITDQIALMLTWQLD